MHFYWESFVFSLVAFLILFWLLSKYAFKPLFGIMEQRREHVQNEIQQAEQNRKQANQLMEDQKKAIQDAREEAMSIIEQAKKTSSRQADEMIQQAKAEAGRIKEDALKEIENEKNKAVAQLKTQVSAMSVMIASKIIEKQIDEKSQKQLIDEYLKEVGSSS